MTSTIHANIHTRPKAWGGAHKKKHTSEEPLIITKGQGAVIKKDSDKGKKGNDSTYPYTIIKQSL